MATPRYFQGATVTGPVKASTAATFKDVVDTLRLCPTLGISRGDFFALDEKKRNEAKQVPFFVPACFTESPSKRVYDNAAHCNLIFLDIDPEKELREGKWVETGRYPAKPFVDDPELLYTALAGFNFAAHLTASSTPERPRMRIIVDAEKIPVHLYAKAAEAIGKLLGLPSITKESKVAVQPMFLPVMFRDSAEEDHPLIAFFLDGRAFLRSDIGVDGESHGPNGHTPGTNGASHQNSKKPVIHGNSTVSELDTLEFLRAPVPEVTLAIAREALFTIDADCSRAEWINIAAALKHQFIRSEDEAITLFDEWSATGSKYVSQTETRAVWDSFKVTPVGRVPVTIRSLLHAAVAAGWDESSIKKSSFAKVVSWMEEEARDITELTEKGVQRILAMPLHSPTQEDILIEQLRAQAKKRFAYTISATSIRKAIKQARDTVKALEKPVEKTREPRWAKRVCYVASPQQFYRQNTGEKYSTTAFNSMYARWLLPTEDALKAAGIEPTPAAMSKPIVPAADYALNHLKIPTVYDYAYDPAQPNEVFFVNAGRKYVNTYSPTYPEMDPANAERAGELFLRHLNNLVKEPEYRRTLIDFMAYMVQFPGRKIRWAVLLQSSEGAGKTFLAEVMKAVLGVEHVKTIDGAAIKSGWNEWAFGKQLVVLEEVRVTGTNKHEIMNTLKPLITNDDISINERNRNNRETHNISNYMMFSNHHDALALTVGDRRYFVVKSPLQTKGQVLALGENYFTPLYAMLTEMPGAMRSWLDDWTISPDFRPNGHAPRTIYVQDLIDDTASDVSAAVRRLVVDGDSPLVQYDIVSAKNLMEAIELEPGMPRVTAQQLAHVLRDEGFIQHGRHLIGEDRHYLWIRPGVPTENVVEVATERLKTGARNLCMDLIYG